MDHKISSPMVHQALKDINAMVPGAGSTSATNEHESARGMKGGDVNLITPDNHGAGQISAGSNVKTISGKDTPINSPMKNMGVLEK